MIDLIELQEYHLDILGEIAHLRSDNDKLLCFLDYFNWLNILDDQLVIDAFLFEPLHLIIPNFQRYSAFGAKPAVTDEILNIFRQISSNKCFVEVSEMLNSNILRIEKELEELNKYLNGLDNGDNFDTKVYFPLSERLNNTSKKNGSIEFLNITINHTKKLLNNEFHVVPSLPSIDEKLKSQIENSWIYAKHFYKNTHQFNIPNVEVLIKFNKKLGIYQGDSLGSALTLAFISEISHHFNSRVKYRINQSVLFTGAVNSKGELIPLQKDITQRKTITAFYSNFHSFVIPHMDKKYAMNILDDENKVYPKRKLNIISVDNIKEILLNEDIFYQDIQKFRFYLTGRIKESIKAFLIFIFLFITFLFFILFSNEEPDFIQAAVKNYRIDVENLQPIFNDETILTLKFDNDDIPRDSSKIMGGKNFEYVKNRFDEKKRAVLLNGIDSYFEFAEGDKYKINFPLSISIWFYKTNNKTSYIFSNDFDTTGYYGIHLGFYPGDFVQLSAGNGGKIGSLDSRKSILTQNPIKLNKWYHVVGIIKDWENMDIYLNSHKQSTIYSGYAESLNYSEGKVNFGRYKTSVMRPTFHYEGVIDDFRLYDRILSEKEINKLFHEKY